jgi:hypothetical protein
LLSGTLHSNFRLDEKPPSGKVTTDRGEDMSSALLCSALPLTSLDWQAPVLAHTDHMVCLPEHFDLLNNRAAVCALHDPRPTLLEGQLPSVSAGPQNVRHTRRQTQYYATRRGEAVQSTNTVNLAYHNSNQTWNRDWLVSSSTRRSTCPKAIASYFPARAFFLGC